MKYLIFLVATSILSGCASNDYSSDKKEPLAISQTNIDHETLDLNLKFAATMASMSGDWRDYHFLVKKYAKLHNPEAENVLGMMYLEGVGVNQDVTLGISYLKRSISNGSENAPFNLGVQYEHGKYNLKKDDLKAFELYKISAERGLNKAQFNVCNMLINGQGVQENHLLAKPYCKTAAENGFVEAWTKYAFIEALDQNVELAFELALKGVRSKDIGAAEFIGSLAKILLPQEAVQQELELLKIIKQSCEEAAMLGDITSSALLIALNQDLPKESYKWFLVLEMRTGKAPGNKIAKIKESLTQKEIKGAMTEAEEIILNTPQKTDYCNSCGESNFGQKS